MRIVAFDTATDDTVAGAWVDGEIIAEASLPPGADGRPVHSKALLDAVTEAAGSAGGWPAIDRVAVGTGPGTFTGIRIGLATARGIALSTGVELVGISTLLALAGPLLGSDRPVLALLDARRGEVFGAVYGPAGDLRRGPFVCRPGDLVDHVGNSAAELIATGPGAVRFREELDRAGVAIAGPEADIHRLGAASLCELGAAARVADDPDPLEPTYLRVPDAQLWLERDGRKAGQ